MTAVMEPTLVATHGPFDLLSTGVAVTQDPTFVEWDEALRWCRAVEHASPFWVGDLLRIGEATFGEQASAAMEVTGLTYQALADAKWVAEKVAPERRRESVPFAHHREVAPLPAEEQAAWLDRCEVEGLTREQLRTQIKVANGEAPELWLLVRCTGVADQEQLAERLRAEGRQVKVKVKVKTTKA